MTYMKGGKGQINWNQMESDFSLPWLWPKDKVVQRTTISFLGLPWQSTTKQVAWTMELCCLTVQEARTLRSRSWHGWFLRAIWENLSHVSLLISNGPGNFCHYLAWRCNISISVSCLHGVLPVCVSVFTFPPSL